MIKISLFNLFSLLTHLLYIILDHLTEFLSHPIQFSDILRNSRSKEAIINLRWQLKGVLLNNLMYISRVLFVCPFDLVVLSRLFVMSECLEWVLVDALYIIGTAFISTLFLDGGGSPLI